MPWIIENYRLGICFNQHFSNLYIRTGWMLGVSSIWRLKQEIINLVVWVYFDVKTNFVVIFQFFLFLQQRQLKMNVGKDLILFYLDWKNNFRQRQHLGNDVEMKCEHYFDVEEQIENTLWKTIINDSKLQETSHLLQVSWEILECLDETRL